MSGPVPRQPTFDWKVPGKYNKLHKFEIEIRNVFPTNGYNKQKQNKTKNANNNEVVRLCRTYAHPNI